LKQKTGESQDIAEKNKLIEALQSENQNAQASQ